MDTRIGRGGVLVAAMLCLCGAWPGQALATHVACGDTITQDTTLDSDLVDCQRDGIVIGADGIRLDLGGHTIDGDSSRLRCCAGVANTGFDGVEIRNGTIQGFDAGIHLRAGANSALIRGLQPAGNRIGIEAADSDNGLFTRNSVHGNTTGIVIGGTFSNVPAGDRIARNEISENHVGISLARTADTAIRNNRLAANTSSAISLDDAANTLIEKNLVVDNGGGGIVVGGPSQGTVVQFNVSARNFVGIQLHGGGTFGLGTREVTVTRNFVSRSVTVGIGVEFSNSNLIDHNIVWQNGSGVPFLDSGGISIFRGNLNQILDNLVSHNRPFGVRLFEAGTNRLERNWTNGNVEDGIIIAGSLGVETTNLVGSNTANRNGDYGIEAIPGIVDEGGNRARGNGNPAQCLNVVCN